MSEEDKKLGFFAKKEPVWVQGIHLGFSLCEEAWEWCNYREIYLMIYLFKWDFSIGARLPKKVKEISNGYVCIVRRFKKSIQQALW